MDDVTPQPDLDTIAPESTRFDPRAVTASALALAALSLPDHTRMSPGKRHLLRLGRAAYLGWYTWDLVRRTPLPDVPAPVLGAVAGAAATLATAPVDEAADGWLADRLRSWGMRRPRLALGLAGAGIGAALALENQLRPPFSDGEEYPLGPEDFFEPVEVPAHARALLERMLEVVSSETDAGSPAPAGLAGTAAVLRGQLDRARASVLRDQPLTTDVYLVVPEDAPRVVPHAQGWPVRAHFEAGGLPLVIELWVSDGYLSVLSIMKRDEDLADDDERWETELLDMLETWPAPDEVRLVMETADGARPVG